MDTHLIMLYPTDFESKIGFSVIRDYLSKHCSFSIGREYVEQIEFLTQTEQIRQRISETWEMLNVMQDSSIDFPQCEMHDLRESLSRIRIQGLCLEEQELFRLRKSLYSLRLLIIFFQTLPPARFPALIAFYEREQLSDVSDAIRLIDAILDKYGQLKDNATPKLAQIRTDLRRTQASVGRTLSAILHQAQQDGMVEKDVTPTLREGRLVIPVSPVYRKKLGGIVHDESATGKTVYVEPQQVVEANNRIRELEGDERRERMHILMQCADQLRPLLPVLLTSQDFLGKVDCLLSKTALAKELNAIAPPLTSEPLIDWKEAFHPLLWMNAQKQTKRSVVPLTIQLNEDNRILIISGPNAGGKSVCLKTVALLQYMLQCGLLVPVREDSLMGCFQSIFIDIGDEQSIDDDLSTYSSHLRNMKYFVRNSNAATLLLIDEFGGGTEPQIGGAIAQAVLEQLNRTHAFGVITTHYDNLKHMAEDTPGIVNGAMLYDREQMKPLFQLSMGQPGSSFAIEIAQQIGLPEEIVMRAKNLVGDEHINYDKHLQDIARDKRYWENKRQQIRLKQKHLEERIAQYDEQMDSIRQKRREILEQAKQESAELLKQTNATIENTIRQIKETNAERVRTKEAREQLNDFRKKVEATPIDRTHDKRQKKSNTVQPLSAEPKEITIGCKVRIKGQTMVGEVVEINGKNAIVAFGNLSSKVELANLEYISARQAKKIQLERPSTNVSDALRQKKLHFNGQLDLRGMRADGALSVLMNYIDDALMVGIEEVRILHGTGTGALRETVRGYLKCLPGVTSFHDAHPEEGGAGITVVEF